MHVEVLRKEIYSLSSETATGADGGGVGGRRGNYAGISGSGDFPRGDGAKGT